MVNSGLFTSMKAKILIRFGIITLVLLIVGTIFATSTQSIKNAQARVTKYTNDKMLLQTAVSDHLRWTNQLISAINHGLEFTGSTDPTTCNFGKFLYSDQVQNDREWDEFIQNIEPLHNKIHIDAKEILSQSSPTQANELYLNNILPTLEDLIIKLNDHAEKQSKDIQSAEQHEEQLIEFQMFAIIVQVAILLGLLVNTFFFIHHEVIKPILHIRKESSHLAQGLLSLDFTVSCKNTDIRQLGESLNHSVSEIKKYIDDIDKTMGEMSNHNFDVVPSQPFIGDFKSIEVSIGNMINDISHVLAQMSLSAGLVSNGSDQLSAGAQTLAQGAAEQASALEELSATITDISGQIQKNAENTDKASEMANDSTTAITTSNEHMQKLMASMYDIDAKSREIRKIIKTIEDIAFQTNILALNAAVEAARAGLAGKGFAVVADEVSNLAAKSADAAKNTTELIESSIAAISGGVKLAQTTADDLLQVVNGAKKTTSVIFEIADATKSQAQAVSQITIGLTQISSVIQQNSATSEESAATSEELSSQAQQLKKMVEEFHIKSSYGGTH